MVTSRRDLVEKIEALLPGMMTKMFPTFQPWAHLSVSQLRTLRFLHTDGPLRVGELAERLGLTPGAVSQTCNKLLAQQLVQRIDIPGDGRGKAVALTDHAQDVWNERVEVRVGHALERLRLVDEFTLERFVSALQALVDSTDTHAAWEDERIRRTV